MPQCLCGWDGGGGQGDGCLFFSAAFIDEWMLWQDEY